MLNAALAVLLALQAASGSPNVASPPPSSSNPPPSSSNPGAAVNPPSSGYVPPASGNVAAPSEAPAPAEAPSSSESAPAPTRPPARAATPTPAPRAVPTPGPRPTGDSLFVVNKTDDSVSILDAATGKPRFTVPVDRGPHEVETFPDGRVAAVSSYGSKGAPGRTVSLVDVGSGKVLSRIDIGEGSRPHGLKVVRDGRLLVTAEGMRELVVVNPREGKVVARYPTGHDISHLVAASPDGKRAYVTSLSAGAVTVIDLADGQGRSRTSRPARAPRDSTSRPTGARSGSRTAPRTRSASSTPRPSRSSSRFRPSEFPIRVKITPDGRRAVVTFTGSGDVRVYDTATREEKARIAIGRDAVSNTESRVFHKRFGKSPAPVGLLISPDGRRAFVSAAYADVVAVIDLDKMRVEDAWTAGREPDGLALSIGVQPTPVPTGPRRQAAPTPPRMVTPRPPG